jgi:hypothetical protein
MDTWEKRPGPFVRYTRFEDKRATGKSVLAVLAACKTGTANDLATPGNVKL